MRLNFIFLQTDGVPLTADLMDTIQQAYAIFNVIGDIAGHLTILSGCEINGTLVNPGIVAINGDVLYFEGGTVYQKVFIHQENIQKVFKNQQSKILIEKKTVKFGDASVTYNWADFVKLKTLKEIQQKVNNSVTQQEFAVAKADIELLKLKTAPIINGGIVWIWKLPASQIPLGWKECTDLRGKTVFGRDPDNPAFSTLGASAGSVAQTILKTNLPNLNTNITIIHPYEGTPGGGGFDGGGNNWKNKTITFNPGGDSTPINILNPHRIVNFIEPNFQ